MHGWEQAEGRSSRTAARVLTVAGLLVLGGVTLAWGGPGDSSDLAVERDAEPLSDDPPDEPADATASEQDPPELPPVAPWHDEPGVPTEDTSDADGLGEWRPMDSGPLTPRAGHVAVWTGDEMLVWGGTGDDHDSGGHIYHMDGALYDPEDDTWRELPEAPVHRPGVIGGVWTGQEFIVLGQPGQAAYEPAADAWRLLADPPDGRWRPGTAVWTGDEMVVLGSQRTDETTSGPAAVAYDPAADAWRELPAPPFGSTRPRTATLDGRVVMFGRDGGDHLIAAYDPEADDWTRPDEIPGDSNVIAALRDVQGGAHGERLVLAGAHYDGSWTALSASWSPPPDGEWHGPFVRSSDAAAVRRLSLARDGTVMWIHGAAVGGKALTSEGWRDLGPSPLGHRAESSVVWTGEELIVWGGRTLGGPTADGARWRPSPDHDELTEATAQGWPARPERH